MKKLILDSNRSSNGNLNSPRWILNEPIACDKIRYNSIILPLSWNIVNSGNNTISFWDTAMRTFQIPTGTYSPDDLVDAITTGMNSVGSQTYTVSFSTVTGKLTVTAAAPFKFSYSTTTAKKLIGLTATTPSDISTVELQQPIDLTGVKMVLVASSSIRSSDVIVAGANDLNIIAQIPISQETQTVLCSQNYFDTDFIDTESGLVSAIDIRLLDAETLQGLDLQGKGFTIVLDCHSSGFTDDA